jgi:DNA-binding transcriptional ArsR family regulator
MMHDLVSRCHIDVPVGREVGPNVSVITPPEGPARLIPAAEQWVSTTLGRAVTDPYSWMQAVHWVHGAGIHKRFNVTTVRLAQLLAELSPCRPGVEYLMRRLELSERAVQYHLAALRETGLLVYVSRGTRRRGQLPQASVFERTVPSAFDVALGIRCTPDGLRRRVVGIAEHGRALIAKLGRKAARKVRKPRRKAAPAAVARCTPMEGGSVLPSLSHSPTSVPLETSGGNSEQHTGNGTKGAPRRLNKVGRRFRLAGEVRARVRWLARTPLARIAWCLTEVSDAGWTADEVEAWLQLVPSPSVILRPSGVLAHRMQGAALVWADPAGRRRALEANRDSALAARERHEESAQEFRPSSDPNVMGAIRAALIQGQAELSASLRERGLDDLTGLSARDAGTDWDTAAKALIAMFGEEACTVLAAAERPTE